jgi:hypothetical protein
MIKCISDGDNILINTFKWINELKKEA